MQKISVRSVGTVGIVNIQINLRQKIFFLYQIPRTGAGLSGLNDLAADMLTFLETHFQVMYIVFSALRAGYRYNIYNKIVLNRF